MPDPTLLFETVHGSRAYGLAREASDTDLKGVVVGPPSWYFGHRGGPEQIELHADHVRFELRKLLRLLVAANPMALELLFTDPADHQVVHPAFRGLLERRDAFLTTRVGQTFGGYALGQLKRIETHRQWLHAPPAAAPTRDAFGLPERTLVSRDQLGALSALEEDGVAPDLSPNFLGMLAREKRYQAAKARWKQFQQWRRTRNPRRSALEKKFGYDTKHAMHLVRLQRMAREILETGAVRVRRPDRAELLAIRDGAWSHAELVERAEANQLAIQHAMTNSSLPVSVDEDAIEALGVSIVQEVLG